MILLYLVFLLFLFTQRRIKDSISKIFIWTFFVLWVLQGTLSQFGIYDNFIPTTKTMMLVSIHMFSFYLGFCLLKSKEYSRKKSGRNTISDLKDYVEIITRSPIFNVVLILSLFYVLYLFSQYWNAIIMAQSITDARVNNQLQEMYGNTYYYLNMIILAPLSTITTFLFAYKTFEKRDWIWLVMGLYLFMYKSLGGGRLGYLGIFTGIVFVGICLVDREKKRKSFFKSYSRYIIIGVLTVGLYYFIGLLTAGRGGDVSMSAKAFEESQETTNMHFFNYYVTPIVAFDYSINHDFVERQGGYHYGALTFNSVEETLYVVLNRIGIYYKRPIGMYGELIQENYINLGSMDWNALYTWCNFFYFDLGLVGLIVFPFIIGILVRKTIYYFYNNINVFSASLLVWVYYIVAMSMVNLYFNGFASFITLVVLLYYSKKHDRKLSRRHLVEI